MDLKNVHTIIYFNKSLKKAIWSFFVVVLVSKATGFFIDSNPKFWLNDEFAIVKHHFLLARHVELGPSLDRASGDSRTRDDAGEQTRKTGIFVREFCFNIYNSGGILGFDVAITFPSVQ